MFSKRYSLAKCRKILRTACNFYKRKWKRLAPDDLQKIEDRLSHLDQAILAGNRDEASDYAKEVEELGGQVFRKSIWDYTREVAIALIFALVIATIVRQMWFEPMEIPSGSMRPTFQELDRLIVTKTNFGLNIPLTTGHFLFEPELVERTGVFIFTSEDMDIPDQDTTYFYLFPGKKRLIKRCMGKPGDTLYFYGGQIYGIDAEGNPLSVYRDSPWMEGIDSIPFIDFCGKVSTPILSPDGVYTPVYFHQFNQEIARLNVLPNGQMRGEIFNGEEWIADRPDDNQDSLHTYGQLYGMQNYAMARLLTRAELNRFSVGTTGGDATAPLYLELRHSPSLTYPAPQIRFDQWGRRRPTLTPEVSVIPLSQETIDRIMDVMTTTRFRVENGLAINFPSEFKPPPEGLRPRFPNVPDGRYQFQRGIAYKVGFGGILTRLPQDHPLYDYSPKNVQRLFNLGVHFNRAFSPHARNQIAYPPRYAYYREGDFYLMSALVLHKGDPLLVAFNQSEAERAANAAQARPYRPFKDWGLPTKGDTLDVDFIRTFGLKIPEKGYLGLGDNYASSGDSRVFGFIPEANIRGAPWKILWPPGPRWGSPQQKPYPFITLPRLIVWVIALITLIWLLIVRYLRNRRPHFHRLSK